MVLGQGGDDSGTSLEVLFDESSKVGKLVVEAVERRSNLKIKTADGREETPNIPFLELSKLSQKHRDLLIKGEKIDEGAVYDAKISSLALSLEAAIQINEAKSVKPPGVFIEDLDSLKDMEAMLGVAGAFVKSESEKLPSTIGNVAMELIQQKELEIPADLSRWANEIMGKAHERMIKKVSSVSEVLGVELPTGG